MIDVKKIIDDMFLKEISGQKVMQIKEEISLLASFFCGLAPKHIMEIGSNSGISFYLFCSLLRDKSGKQIMLDLVDKDKIGYGLDHEGLKKRNEWILQLVPDAYLLNQDSHDFQAIKDVKEILGEDKLDFLFLDGDHTFSGVKQDYFTYKKFVRSGGAIIFHDVNYTEIHKSLNCRVDLLWKEIEGEKIEFNTKDVWGGIGVLIK